jgi:hypothetical protein
MLDKLPYEIKNNAGLDFDILGPSNGFKRSQDITFHILDFDVAFTFWVVFVGGSCGGDAMG